MKKRKIFIIAAVVLVLIAGLGIYAAASRNRTELYETGKAFAEASGDSEDRVVAVYQDSQITQSLVDYEKHNMSLLQGGEPVTDREATDQLLRNIIILDEAAQLGISVTQDEVDEVLSMQRKNYEDYEDAKAIVDDFCAGAGITTEEYFSIIEEQLSRMILRQKLRDALGQQYCDEHGLTFTKVNPPEEMTQYVEKTIDQFVASHKKDIVYYPD